jgi:GH3 auxin-responsive promoter
MNWCVNRWLTMQLATIGFLERIRLQRVTRDPMRSQRAVLARIIAENRDTTFGRFHGFAITTSYDDFANRVPISDFEKLRPLIESEIETGEAALTSEAPHCYVRTSGTTGKPKDLPLTITHLRSLRRIQRTSLAFQYRTCPEMFSGSILAIVSPGHEGFLANGKSFGSASGIVAGSTQRQVADKFVVPAPVLTLQDSRLKYLLILRLALGRPDISCIGTANPTTLLILGKLYREHRTELLTDLREGTFFLAKDLSVDVLTAVRTRIKPCPGRADELARLHMLKGVLQLADLWPALRMIVTWTCASAGIAIRSLRRELSPATRILELGYIASEFRGTVTLGRRAGSGLPTLDTHFFEFAERQRWERGETGLVTLDKLKKGVDYYVVITTPSGLYRYFINDLVRVTGFLHKTALLKFLQKGKGVTNITGEKLCESQVLAAVRKALDEIGRTPCFIMMLADEDARTYHLYAETDAGSRPTAELLAEKVDRTLAGLNVEYKSKRESRRLEAVEAHWLRADTGDAYRRFCVQEGQREGQFKSIALAYRREFRFDLEAQIESA